VPVQRRSTQDQRDQKVGSALIGGAGVVSLDPVSPKGLQHPSDRQRVRLRQQRHQLG
jgi:hypothetical protein